MKGDPLPIKQGEKHRLKELDGWRALSVLAVIAHHLGAYQYAGVLGQHARSFTFIGALGVKVFFVISGLVICRLLILEEQRYGSASLKSFYIRRVFRILPPLYLMIGVLAVLTSCKLIVNSRHALFNASFFLFDFLYANVHGWSWFAGHTWSLAVEEQFYLVFPAVWILTRRIGREWVFSCAFFLSILWDLLPTISSWDGLLIRSGREGFACICCGVLIATFDARVRTIARAVPLIVVAAVALVLVWHPVSGTDWKRALYECIFVPPAISLLLIFSLEHRGWLSAFLRWRLVQAIGLTSYGIYLWQELFTAPFDNYVGSGERISFLLPLLFAVVPISWFFVEKPAMRLGRSLAQRVRRNPIRERTPMPAQVAPDFTVE